MNHRIPFTRLSIVFILAMVLSGGILTYFSINNISNLKELTEKRILEEQQELAARFATSLQEALDQLAAGLVSGPEQLRTLNDTLEHRSADQEFIIQPFLLRNNGKLIYPNFTGISDESFKPILSNGFRTAYALGEEAEFVENDPLKARKYYRTCLSLSRGTMDSVTALNALGRVSVKSGRIGEATEFYISIIRDYSSQTDRNGFPFAYYALSHLVGQTDNDHIEEIVPVIEYCLERTELGLVPLNYQSGELFDQVTEWVKKNSSLDSVQFSQINGTLKSLKKQVEFVDQYGDELQSILPEYKRKLYADQNGFRIEQLSDGVDSLFLLLTNDSTYISGVLINQNLLFDSLANAGLQEGLGFNYICTFSAGYNSNTLTDNPSYSAQLIPYFPEQALQISLQNENLIKNLVTRRSWIYGIATSLLLVAMLLGIILVTRDIAREKKLVNLRSEFTSNVTHELKTPLTSIRMYAESLMMQRIKSAPDQHKSLSVIVNESERLKRMINNILEFSKMEKARQDYHPVESNLSGILHSAIQDMDYWLEKNSLTLKQEIEPDIIASVDTEKFYQVYTNLLSNAIKYSGESRNIYIRLYRNHDAVITEVEDEGIGIAEEDQLKIFDEFYRVENHGSGNITGTGLGLTVVREIVEAHHGKIKVESEIGKGSKFSVILFQ